MEVPVSYHNRRFGQSKVSGTVRGTILAGWHILNVTFRYAWRRYSRNESFPFAMDDIYQESITSLC